MAKIKLGPHVAAISGTIGDLTYVPLNGEQTVRHKAKPAKRTAGQNIQPGVIGQAAAYWRLVKADPAKKAIYLALPRVPGLGLYQFAVRDFCNPPVVEAIDVSGYAGRVGDPIRIRATDDTAVKQVHVRILDMNGGLLEEGAAAAGEKNADWTYQGTTNVVSGQSVTVRVTATDHPDHATSKECLAYVR